VETKDDTGAEIGDPARAESLAAIQGQVIDAEPVEGAQAGGCSGGVPMDASTEARELIRFATALFFPLYPSLARIYTEPRQEQLAVVSAPLMAKYGLSLGAIFERWGAEINFALVALPLAGETVKAIKADNQARKEAAEREAKEKEAAAHADQ
jgi:hypothetical protein